MSQSVAKGRRDICWSRHVGFCPFKYPSSV